MRWNVEGVDARTGRRVKVAIEAPTLAEAKARARYNGISDEAEAAAAAPLAYATPRNEQPTPPAAPVVVRGLTNGLQKAGVIGSILSTIVIFVGAWALDKSDWGTGRGAGQAVAAGVVMLCVFLLLFAAGRMRA